MKTSNKWNFRPLAGKIMMGFVLVSMISTIAVAPAFGKDNRRGHDNRRYEQKKAHGHYVGKRAYRPYGHYGHRERVYYPAPPVLFAPPPPPGVSIFFPPVFIHP